MRMRSSEFTRKDRKMLMSKVVVFLMLVVVYRVHGSCSTPWKSCSPSSGFSVDSLSIQGCCSSPCSLIKGTNSSISIQFKPSKDLESVQQKLCGMISGVCISLKLDSSLSNVCKHLDCPLSSSNTYNLTLILPVKTSYPSMSLTVKWRLYDSDGVQACVKFPVQIKSTSKQEPEYTPEPKPLHANTNKKLL